MFDIAFSELLIIGVVALLVIGPEKLPKVARTVGHLLGKAQRYVSDVKSEINREMEIEELRKLQAEMQTTARKVETDVQSTLRDTESSLNQSVKSIEDDIAELEKTNPSAAVGPAQPSTAQAPQESSASAQVSPNK
ncbi:MAG TPA: Sec-independent protein translocase protein TatB [Limnobacter sp.]|nr:Sec-independent protein translocase protein TatB [Limnobacter sp.]